MIGQKRRAIANAIARWLFRVMPTKYGDWAIAMESECKAIRDPKEAMNFAFGCLWTCFKQRSYQMEFKIKAGHHLLVGAALLLAVITMLSATRIWNLHQPTGLVFAILSAVYGLSALVGFVRGTKAIFFVSVAMSCASAIALFGLNMPLVTAQAWVNIALYRALALEGIAIWGVLAVIGGMLTTLSGRQIISK
jgi:hypothetical protein